MKQLRYVPKKKKDAQKGTSTSSARTKLEAKKKEIRDKARELTYQNFYEMLGIQQNASTDDVRKAFFDAARKYHPDKLPSSFSAELKDAVQHVFASLSTAHSTLVDPDARKQYDSKLAIKRLTTSSIPPPVAKSRDRSMPAAEKLYHMSLVYEQQNQIDKALEAIERAKKLNPKEGDYLAFWAHLQGRLRPRNASCNDLIEKLEQALEWNPRSERILLYLAQLLKRERKIDLARGFYEKVLEVNPDNREAGLELGLMNMRKKTKHK